MLNIFEGRSRLFWIIAGIVLVMVLGIADYLTGNEFSFSLFYLIPITITAWYMNRPMGTFISILSATTLLIDDFYAGKDYSHPLLISGTH